MNDPKRLLEESDGFAAELLRAGRNDAISTQSYVAITAALGVAAPLAVVSAPAVGSKLATLKGVLALGGIGTVGALSVWAGIHLFSDGAPAPTVPPHSEQRAPAVAVVKEAEPVESARATEAAEPEPPKSTARDARPAVTAERDTLPRELELIDRARGALARGDAAQALSLLDTYAARFPKPQLRAESTVLRIEALVARGQSAAAARLGKDFLAREPNGPYARRVRSLLDRAGAAPSR